MLDPYTDLEINCRSQLSILEACRHENPAVKIVFASTRQIYGRPQRLPVDEKHPIAPVDVNGINKTAGEWFHLLYGDVYGLRTTALRLTNTYGPRMRVRDARQTFLGIWLRLALQGGEILVFGDGCAAPRPHVRRRRGGRIPRSRRRATRRTVASTTSAASAICRSSSSQNSSSAPPGAASSRLVPFPEDRKSIDIGDFYADWAAIERDLGWRPTVAVETGLRRTLDYYREHGAHYWDAE